jgi:hypothetical protein
MRKNVRIHRHLVDGDGPDAAGADHQDPAHLLKLLGTVTRGQAVPMRAGGAHITSGAAVATLGVRNPLFDATAHLPQFRNRPAITCLGKPHEPAHRPDGPADEPRRHHDRDRRARRPHRQPHRYEVRSFPRKLDQFLKAEGAVAWARMSIRPNGLVHGESYLYRVGDTASLPAVELAQEDYRRLALAKVGPVTLAINSHVHFVDTDTKAYNILADLPGSDPKATSWPAPTWTPGSPPMEPPTVR